MGETHQSTGGSDHVHAAVPIRRVPFDVPEEPSDGIDYAEQVWAQVGDYDAYGPFEGRDDDFTPF